MANGHFCLGPLLAYWIIKRARMKARDAIQKKCEDHDRENISNSFACFVLCFFFSFHGSHFAFSGFVVLFFLVSCFHHVAVPVCGRFSCVRRKRTMFSHSKWGVIEAIKTVRLHFMSPQALVGCLQLAAAASLLSRLHFFFHFHQP